MAISGKSENAARNDAINYLYDMALDPRYSLDTQNAISNLTQGVSLEASRRAAAGEGEYSQILQSLMNQTGLSEGGTDVYLQRLRDTGSLGLRDMGGASLDNQLTSGKMGNYSVWNGRLIEPWEGIEQNRDGTYTIFDSRDREQMIRARENALNGGTALDLSANSPMHDDTYWTAMERYNNLVNNGYEFSRHDPNGGAAAVLNEYAGGNNGAYAAPSASASVSTPIASVPAGTAAASGATRMGGSGGGGTTTYGYTPSATVYNSAAGRGAAGGNGSPYSSALRNAQGGFEWDKEQDPAYQAYRDAYTRAANQATTDTLGQISARTGGLASSYATQAAAQAYNNQMDNLNNIIPELYENAYNRFANERAYADAQEEKEYQRAMQQDQINYERNLAEKEMQANNYSNLLNLMTKYGYVPTANELSAAGLSEGMRDAILGLGNYAPEIAQALGFTSSGTGSSTGKTSNTTKQTTPKTTAQEIINALSGNNAGTDTQYYTYLSQAQTLPATQQLQFISNLVKGGLISELQGSQLLSRLGL